MEDYVKSLGPYFLFPEMMKEGLQKFEYELELKLMATDSDVIDPAWDLSDGTTSNPPCI